MEMNVHLEEVRNELLPKPHEGSLECDKCGDFHRVKISVALDVLNRHRSHCCEDVIATRKFEEQKARQLKQQREREWQGCAPGRLFESTDPDHPSLNKEAFRRVMEWDPDTRRGLLLGGPTGRGKTRMAVYKLRQLNLAGLWCFYVTAARFSTAAATQFSDVEDERKAAKNTLHSCLECEVLVFDDLGKGKLTDRAEAHLFELADERMAHERPTIWTTNATEEQLRRMLSKDRADPLLRRITNFTEVITC